MPKLPFILTSLLALTTTAATAVADDDVAPVSDAPDGQHATMRGVQGPKGMFAARISLAMNLSSDLVAKPFSIAPDLYYSATDKLQFGIIHDGPMRWQSRPGLGLCLTGEDNGCARVYDSVGLDVMYGLSFEGNVHLSAHATLFVTSFDASTTMLAVGAAGKYHFNDDVALFYDPQIGIALNKRDFQDDALFVPLELQFQAGPENTVKVLSGLQASLQEFGDTLQVPVGLGFVRNVNEHVDLGIRFSFDNLLGKQIDGIGRADTRSAAALVTYRN